MKYIAHLLYKDGAHVEQTLKDHCTQTAIYAANSLSTSGFYHTGYLTGLLHDMGKAKKEFVDYLETAVRGEQVVRGSVNHTFAGAVYMLERFHTDSSDIWEKLTSEVIAYAIGAHHGMFDCVDLDGKNGFMHRLQKDRKEIGYEESIHHYFEEVVSQEEVDSRFKKAKAEIQTFFSAAKAEYEGSFEKVFFQISMLTRMLLSAVINGDRRDTFEFMNQHVGKVEVDLPVDWTKQWKYLENKIQNFDCTSPLNQVRGEISKQCLDFAQKPCGIYRLNVPTGGGKTIASYRYMLAHAKQYQKKRIIFIIPLLSVLEQNAKVIRDYTLDQDMILEHHSNVVHEKKQGDELDPYEMTAESWDAPIVISTMVQLLNLLFSSQTSAVRRMRALCDSVIVIDEVQSLPKKVTAMFNMAMNFLSRFCRTTIVLSSATQPCFEEIKWPLHFAGEPDMVRLSREQLTVFQRAEIVDKTDKHGMDLDECVSFFCQRMEQQHSLLVICNTKNEARQLYQKMKEVDGQDEWELYHLSTAMCQKHRTEVLEEIQGKLSALQCAIREKKKGKKLICISTQLVEAGVDFSFEAVVRVLAGVDNLAQAAGRCNRSNEYEHPGMVYLIKLKQENLSMLKEISCAQDSTRNVLACKSMWAGESLIGETATRLFYHFLFEASKAELEYPVQDQEVTFYLAKLLGNRNDHASKMEKDQYQLRQPFLTIGRMFRVFDENTTDVLVPYENGKQIIEELRSLEDVRNFPWKLQEMKKIMQQAKFYTVSLYEWQKKKLDDNGMLHRICSGRILVLNEQVYDGECGLTIIKEQAVENFVL